MESSLDVRESGSHQALASPLVATLLATYAAGLHGHRSTAA